MSISISSPLFAHSHNLCLQDAGRKIVFLRDASESVREITNLIKFSPKERSCFTGISSTWKFWGTIKPRCLTWWTARHVAIEAVLKGYAILMKTMGEVNFTTYNEYRMKSGRIIASLQNFQTYFGLQLAHTLFGALESLSRSLEELINTRSSISCEFCQRFL